MLAKLWGSGTVTGGSGLELGRWLKAGDVIELEIEGIGTLRNTIVLERAADGSRGTRAREVREELNPV